MKIFSNNGLSPLHEAIKAKNFLLLHQMHLIGVDMEQLTRDGKSPMTLAQETNATDVIAVLQSFKELPRPSVVSIYKPEQAPDPNTSATIPNIPGGLNNN